MTLAMPEITWEQMIDLEVHLAKEVSCEYPECSNAATWRRRHTCCGLSILNCDEHKREVDEFVRSCKRMDFLRCLVCHGKTTIKWVKI